MHTYGHRTYCNTQLPFIPRCQYCRRACCCNTLQHTATHCNTLQHTATHRLFPDVIDMSSCDSPRYKRRLTYTARPYLFTLISCDELQCVAVCCSVLQCVAVCERRLTYTARPYESCKIFKGWPPRDAPSKLVQLWYKSFPPDWRGLVEMKDPTRLSNKTSNA